MKKLSLHHTALVAGAILTAATAFLVANHLSAEPSPGDRVVINHSDQGLKAGVIASPKGTDSDSGTYIHPVVQDNGVGNGDKAVRNGLNEPQQSDYHQSQAN